MSSSPSLFLNREKKLWFVPLVGLVTEGVFCSFHCICSCILKHLFLLLPLQTLGCSDFALRASRVCSYVRKLLWSFSLLQLCLVGRWVGLVGLHPCADVLAGGFTCHLQ